MGRSRHHEPLFNPPYMYDGMTGSAVLERRKITVIQDSFQNKWITSPSSRGLNFARNIAFMKQEKPAPSGDSQGGERLGGQVKPRAPPPMVPHQRSLTGDPPTIHSTEL